MINEIQEQIKKANNILLHCHPSPDPDSVGSTLAMKFALEQLGKRVTLIKGDSDIPKAFDFPGVETIVGKNYFEIDINEFDTFIILDSGSIEMISAKDKITFPDSLTTIIIDHHVSNVGYGKINYIDPTYSSTAELVHHILVEMGVSIDRNIALNLFMGMYTDTGGFRYGINGPRTLKLAASLTEIAPDYQKTISTMENSNRIESLVFESLVLSSVKTYYDGKLALAHISNDDLIKNNILNGDRFTGYISNKIKSVLGVEIAGTLVEVEPGKVKCSFKSKDAVNYDVSKLAVKLGGGGHKQAAGANLKSGLSEAIETVVKTVKEIYNV
jgi:phosphoesterase RecJ-like protein